MQLARHNNAKQKRTIMKQLIIISTITALSITASARSLSKAQLIPKFNDNSLSTTYFDLEGDKMKFNALPKKTVSVCIIDENGNIELFTDINRRNNTIDISKLPEGRHNITVKSGNELKAFGYFSGTVIKASRPVAKL